MKKKLGGFERCPLWQCVNRMGSLLAAVPRFCKDVFEGFMACVGFCSGTHRDQTFCRICATNHFDIWRGSFVDWCQVGLWNVVQHRFGHVLLTFVPPAVSWRAKNPTTIRNYSATISLCGFKFHVLLFLALLQWFMVSEKLGRRNRVGPDVHFWNRYLRCLNLARMFAP